MSAYSDGGTEDSGRQGWQGRVGFGRPERPVAFRPGAVLVPREVAAAVERPGWNVTEDVEGFSELTLEDARWIGLSDEADPDAAGAVAQQTIDLVDDLRAEGIEAQPDHVLFADGVQGNPFTGNPFTGNPFTGNPFTGNPFTGNPFTGNPFTGNGWPTGHERESGVRPSTARPAAPVPMTESPVDSDGWPVVLVLDTGLPDASLRPMALQSAESQMPVDTPDSDADMRLDPVAGHGTFIAGIVSRLAPGCRIIVEPVLTSFGDGAEKDVARVLRRYAGSVDLVNLSFGTYTPFHPRVLERAVRAVQRGEGPPQAVGEPPRPAVVVASAGNDGTWVPPVPASLPGVISVAALDRYGPAAFSNFGPWVSACAPGTDVVSTFFEHAQTDDGEQFAGWATWSGTSFAAPHVVGALARAMQRIENVTANSRGAGRLAVSEVLDTPTLLRLPMYGTVINIA